MFTLAICTILNGYTQVNVKMLLIQSYHTTCVSFSCEFTYATRIGLRLGLSLPSPVVITIIFLIKAHTILVNKFSTNYCLYYSENQEE